MYIEKQNYFAALHLSGTRDKILGEYLEERNIESSFESEKNSLMEVAKALSKKILTDKEVADIFNAGRNAVKHKNGAPV
ncbi:MAG: hypothetical protein HQL29_01870 [Candidatus Omnitrophica bacterium]|nr:hypothetical protein [Candidatus Omnitrophota bacterium]